MLQELLQTENKYKISTMTKDIIAFWGYPEKSLIKKTKNEYPNAKWVDLDIDIKAPDLKLLPENYCVIIKNIYNNALFLKDKIIKILAPIGKDKCDSAYFASEILKEAGFCVIQTIFEDVCPDLTKISVPISKSSLPLKEKIELITKNIVEQKEYNYLKQSNPRFGFWGVPPNDLSLLDLFPDGTEVFGWCRAVEAGYPGDYRIETYVDKNIPTIFFTQAFCSKTQLAKYLANKYEGLFIDVDVSPNASIRAKIEAFIKLR